MRAVEHMLQTSTAPIEVRMEIRAEVERRRKEPSAKEFEICLYVQSVLRAAELRVQNIRTIPTPLQKPLSASSNK